MYDLGHDVVEQFQVLLILLELQHLDVNRLVLVVGLGHAAKDMVRLALVVRLHVMVHLVPALSDDLLLL